MKDGNCCSQHTSGDSETLEFQFQGTPCSLEFSKSTVCMCAYTQIKKFTPKAQLFDLREFQDLAFSMEAEGEEVF